MTISPSLSISQFLSPFFMQDPKNSHTRKRWYQRAIEATTFWKALSKPIEMIPIKISHHHHHMTSSRKLRKCTSTKVFSHVCLGAPISSSYTDQAPIRRSLSYARSRSVPSSSAAARVSADQGRRIFRGKSLTDDVLMRRFVVDEEAMRRRNSNEMEIIRRRSGMMMVRNRNIGPSPLSRMVLAQAEAEAEAEAHHHQSTD